jgi:negative regulator of sigma E activity
MNTDSQFNDRSLSQLSGDVSNGMAEYTNESTGTKDLEKRNYLQYNEADRFELLSAYLDGEVTAAERKQVEQWLDADESVKCLYARLLRLRQGVKTMPIPAPAQSSDVTFKKVWQRLSYRYQLGWMFGGAAVVVCVLGTVSSLIPGNTSKLQFAQQKIEPIATFQEKPVPVSPLMVALNNPVIEIPKTAVASPRRQVYQSKQLEQRSGLDVN